MQQQYLIQENRKPSIPSCAYGIYINLQISIVLMVYTFTQPQ